MEAIVYLRYSDLYGQRLSLATLKKKLRQLKRTNALFSLCQINILLCRQRSLGSSNKEMGDLQELLAANFLDDDIFYSKLKGKYNSYFNPVFSRQQILFLFRLCILECSEDATVITDGQTDGGFKLGECCLIASDHLVSPKEEKAASEGSSVKRRRHLSLQLAPTMELNNPLRMKNAIVRSEIMFRQILVSDQYRKGLSPKYSNFDIEQKFFEATGITINQYVEFTSAVLSNFLGTEDKDILANPSSLFFRRNHFLSQAKVNQTHFDLYLKLESKTIEKFKKSLEHSKKKVHTPFAYTDFRSSPILELKKDLFICIDPCFLTERLGAGIFWRILDSLKTNDEKHTFFEFYGFLFEEYVNRILEEIPHKGYFLRSPKYKNGEECFDAIIYYPETKHLLVFECKASFMRIDAKYSGQSRKFEKELKMKFLAKEGNKPKGVGQIAVHLERLFNKNKDERHHLKDIDLLIQDVEKVSPIFITQETILRFNFIEERLNNYLNQILKNKHLKDSVKVNPLTVIDIDILERLKPYLAQELFTLEQCINSRAHRDPKYNYLFYSFLYENFPVLRTSIRDNKIEDTFDEVMDRIRDTLFDREEWYKPYEEQS